MTTPAQLYRLLTGEKVGSARLLLYPILGYGISGHWAPWLWLLNTAIIFGGVLFASLLNDYYDYLLLGEKNAVADSIDDGTLSHRLARFLTWAPWIGSLVCFFVLAKLGVTTLSLILLWASFLLSAAYCAPPLRLKGRSGWGLVTPPVGIFLLFLQGLVLVQLPDVRGWLISVMLFLYTWYLDFLHLSEDSLHAHEIHRLPGLVAVKAARFTAAGACLVAACMAWFEPILLIGVVAWGMRAFAVFRRGPEEIAAARKNLLSPIYRIEEFPLYVIVIIAAL